VPDNVLGEKIKAVIWPMPGEKLAEEEVKEFCKGRIADYKVPDYVAFTELPLPRNPGGKILKKELLDK
jgi:acyl-CoA synthetase (AMP-forming)/AMP-acid ligase II